MNRNAYDAIEEMWQACVKVRALCPATTEASIGRTEYESPSWYKNRGANYFVKPENPFTAESIGELKQMTAFVNRSFIIAMASMLEFYRVVPYRKEPDLSIPGGEFVQLAKLLRHRFAHGEYEYDETKSSHVRTRNLLEKLLPEAPKGLSEFPAAIDSVLEPLKNGVLQYVAASRIQ